MSKTLKILSRPQGNAEEYGRWAVNPYKGCSHGCLYCYLKKGVWANGLGGNTAQLKTGVVNDDHAYHLAMAEIIEHREEIIKDGGLFMTFTSDPCAPETFRLFCRISESAREIGIPVTMLTKAELMAAHIFLDSTIPSHYLTGAKRKDRAVDDYLNHCYKKASLLAIGFTLTGHDELEPNASPNVERIKEINFLTQHFPPTKGCHVWASIEPVIDFCSALDMICLALDAGCEHFKIGLLTNNTRVVRKPFSFGEHHFEAYDRAECMSFTGNVMELTQGRATVYWKQSFYDFFGDEPIHGMTAYEFLHQWSHSVDKDWNMFQTNK